MIRRFIEVEGRQVHLRQCGTGPAAVVLHQTPQSSVTMEPLMRLLTGFTVFAPDSPGFGLSDPLPGSEWDIGQLAGALAGLLDALGLERVALLGQHTGATIATEFARRWPQRVCSLAADGYTAFSIEERRTILPHQLPRFEPTTDGAHLAWAWSRFRDGWMFFPWSDRRLARRRALDMPPASLIHDWQIMELLRSGEAYRAVYPGVFAFDGVAAARALRCPAMLGGDAGDQLYPHLDRLDALPDSVKIARFASGDRAGLWQAMADFTRTHGGGASIPPETTFPPETGPRAYVRLPDGRHIAIRRRHGAGVPVLALHGAGASGQVELARMPVDGPVIAPDLPGHGDSDPSPNGYAPGALAVDLAACLRALGLSRVRLRGRGLGAAVAAELARACPDIVASVRLGETMMLSAREAAQWHAEIVPDTTPRNDGTHLLTLWHALRDGDMYWPWFETRASSARTIEPALDAGILAPRFHAALRCADLHAAFAAWIDWDARAGLSGLAEAGFPVEIAAVPGDGWSRDAGLLARLSGGTVIPARPDGDGLSD
ncbi:MAG: alpha/beta fold hydrolase [Pararhodobacter sp.]|nr:alpha/beta fold hydrolase [Pararhodobacter sp.]